MGQSDDGKSKPMLSATGQRVSNGGASKIKVGITDQSGSEHIIDSVLVEGLIELSTPVWGFLPGLPGSPYWVGGWGLVSF